MNNIRNKIFDKFKIDTETSLHSWRTAYYSSSLAMCLGIFPKEEIIKIKELGLLHDVGKCMIPQNILSKAELLNQDEFIIIRKHPVFSVEILSSYGFSKSDLSIIRAHHEKLDGSGYPDGLREGSIPIQSQIISVADIYDALTSKRSYRQYLHGNKYGHKEAINIMINTPGLNKLMITTLDQMIMNCDWPVIKANRVFT